MGARRKVTISLVGVTGKNIKLLELLNTAVFGDRHGEKYYADALASYEFTKLAYYGDICVGLIACKLTKNLDGNIVVHIMTLGVLARYRRLGIGTRLLNHVLDLCSTQNISKITLRVQPNNEGAINLYKKFGFEITETDPNYYANITPPACYFLTKFINQTQA